MERRKGGSTQWRAQYPPPKLTQKQRRICRQAYSIEFSRRNGRSNPPSTNGFLCTWWIDHAHRPPNRVFSCLPLAQRDKCGTGTMRREMRYLLSLQNVPNKTILRYRHHHNTSQTKNKRAIKRENRSIFSLSLVRHLVIPISLLWRPSITEGERESFITSTEHLLMSLSSVPLVYTATAGGAFMCMLCCEMDSIPLLLLH